MTASSTCHKCEKIAYNFHYTNPNRKPTDSTHTGYWHCEQHGPITHDTSNEGRDVRGPYPHLNRAERRKLARKTR